MSYIRITFKTLLLHEDENWGDTHVALYADVGRLDANDSFLRTEPFHFRWNSDDNQISENEGPEEGGGYSLSQQTPTPDSPIVRIKHDSVLRIQGFANDDRKWPGRGNEAENYLGEITMRLTRSLGHRVLGEHVLGPSTTDEGKEGFSIILEIEEVPDPALPPRLTIHGLEVAQCIQNFREVSGDEFPSNEASLVAHRATLVRVYLESGTDSAHADGLTLGITGVLTFNGSRIYSRGGGMTARRWDEVDFLNLEHSLNFLIPAEIIPEGSFSMEVQVSIPDVAEPIRYVEGEVTFHAAAPIRIRVVLLKTSDVSPHSPQDAEDAAKKLLQLFPVASDPAIGLDYGLHPVPLPIRCYDPLTGSYKNADLENDDDRFWFLNDLEDLQEDYDDDSVKVYGLLPDPAPAHAPFSRDSDHVAVGTSELYELAHEMGHLYYLDHANCGVKAPDPMDPGYGDGGLGGIGYFIDESTDNVEVVAIRSTDNLLVRDMMGYCRDNNDERFNGIWVSVHSWERLRSQLRR